MSSYDIESRVPPDPGGTPGGSCRILQFDSLRVILVLEGLHWGDLETEESTRSCHCPLPTASR